MRRSRHAVKLSDGSTSTILAYAGQEAAIRAYYARRGKTVVSIRKGDARSVAPTGGHQVIQAELRRAIRHLGLTLPVKVRHNGRAGGTNGNYRFKDDHHDIMLKGYLTPEQASSTLWHELTHALQAERAESTGTWNSYRNTQHRYPYRRRPMEREANAMSAKMIDWKLCR